MTALSAAARADDLADLCEPLETKSASTDTDRTTAPKGDSIEALALETAAISTKTAASVRDIEAKLGKVFEHFKASNDEADKDRQKKGAADPITEERTSRINQGLDEIEDLKRKLRIAEIKAARPGVGGRGRNPVDQKAQMQTLWRKAADVYMRTGDDRQLREFQAKAMSNSVNADGGFSVFAEREESILDKLLLEMSPMRQLATVRSISTLQYTKMFGLGGADSGWVAETAARTATNTPQIAQLTYNAMEIYANPGATQQILDDSSVDLEAWLAEEVNERFAAQEGNAFVKGDGVAKPKGFLDYTKVANASWTHGNIGYVATGQAAAFSSAPFDELINLTMAVKAGHRQGARFMSSRGTLSTLRKIKDTTGQYIWTPSMEAGVSGQLLGYPVTEDEEMPAVAANAYPIAFGNFARGYLIVDRKGVNVLRDPFTNKPYIHFYTTKRVGGGVHNFEAIKLLKIAAS